MQKFAKIIFVSLILLSLTVIGCNPSPPYKAYLGPDLPDDRTAKIVAKSETGINFVSVDGKNLPWGYYPETIYVLPGKHTLSVEGSSWAGWANSPDLWLVAYAAKIYIIKCRISHFSEGNFTQFWIEESDTGKMVGGVRGSDDEPK